ncbi:MAG: zinc-dependent metalloprotease [Actinomycetota bacterium]|nr:zinc-dependent metalloprotease [Actinomycetota bacterium]
MIDWAVARRVGGLALGEEPEPQLLPGDLIALAEDAERRVVAYTGLQPARPLPPPESVGRRAWLDANLVSMQRMLDPVAESLGGRLGSLPGPVRSIAGAALGAQVGGLGGLLGRRVLGQYDLALLDGDIVPRLLFVEPNLREAADELAVDPAELVAWVCFHEVTHAVQFGGVPWLRPHLGGLLGELLSDLEPNLDLRELLKLPSAEDVKAFVGAVRSGELLRLVGGEGKRATLDRVQATMALVEGHAEHVMDVVGADALDDLPALRAALDRRREDRLGRDGIFAWLERLLGLELKLRQYTVGKAFCDEVAERGGVEALNVAFASPELAPSLAELEDPAGWLARTAS